MNALTELVEGLRPRTAAKWIAAALATAGLAALSSAQVHFAGNPADPAANAARLQRSVHSPLIEQYIWTSDDAAALRPDHVKFNYRQRERKTEPHVFRGWFRLSKVPPVAMLYIAGPRSVKAYLNGKLILDAAADPKSPLAAHVFRADVGSALRTGRNVLAIEAVRGFGAVAASDSPVIQQLAFGETLVAKIVPAAAGTNAPPLMITNKEWRSVVATPPGWQAPGLDNRAWPRVQTLGSIESSPDFFQWNLDAGLYDWPGYMGMSPYLRTYRLPVANITHETGEFQHMDALMKSTAGADFAVQIPAEATEAKAPALLLDFGREAAGRLLTESACDCKTQVLVSYGESEAEALSGENYLGTNLLRVPPHNVARGPKSGFRFAWLRFVGGAPRTAIRAIRLEGIAYPVKYEGFFESSDPVLNRIWQTAAYTAHLCMGDGIWDAPKRDRGWWAGDLDVTGPVIGDVFGDRFLLGRTLMHLIPPAGHDVNGIPGYTAQWITTMAALYRRSGPPAGAEVERQRAALLQLLRQMDSEFDASGQFIDRNNAWLFVDWSPGLYAHTPGAVEGTFLEFVRGYREGAWLLGQMDDSADARYYNARADALAAQGRKQYLNANGVFSGRWQLNAMAVVDGVATAADYPAIWTRIFEGIGQNGTQTQTISPYFNDYLIEAMSRMGHMREALAWIREYWGAMLDEGATSFWEAYDLRWPKEHPHRYLQADGTTGYFVSMAHGWSSGPASWLMEEVLGVKATEPGFSKLRIRPELAGLKWARGAVATPHGAVRVEASTSRIQIAIPAGVKATVILPQGAWKRNGTPMKSKARSLTSVVLDTAGDYAFVRQ
jgi:alpha-L-rhamnosidase